MPQRRIEDHSSHREPGGDHLCETDTLAQVRENTESTARQYGLAGEAARLGWAALGHRGHRCRSRHRPAARPDNRAGFKDIVGRVCLGEVGAIFGLEMSRLARSSRTCRSCCSWPASPSTLVVDTDGVYDLADYSDRLVLGFKSQMSEAELHILSGRLQGAKRALPPGANCISRFRVGFVYDDEEGDTIIDPDEEVQAALADVFAAFEGYRLGLSGRRRVLRPSVSQRAPMAARGPASCVRGAHLLPGLRRRSPTRPMRAPTYMAASAPGVS